MLMARVTRLTVRVSSISSWNCNRSNIVATGNSPPYAVRFLAPKSYGVEAPILLGSGITASAPCLAGVLWISFFLLITVWVTPENQLAEFLLRGSSVLTQDFRGPQMGCLRRSGDSAQRACINRLSTIYNTVVLGTDTYLGKCRSSDRIF